MRVLIVDDHAKVRLALKLILEEIEGAEIVGEAENGDEAIALTQQRHPDLIIMDYLMGKMDGIETTRIIHKQYPNIKIIILTTSVDPPLREKALENGAALFISKYGSIEDLLKAILSLFP